MRVKVIGGGLAGCEAALQLADAGVDVSLYEMRPGTKTPAHKTGNLAELVCSNSFKGLGLTSAHGLFKQELISLGARLIPLAQQARVPAGESLAVDRDCFSGNVQEAVLNQPRITLMKEEVTSLNPEEPTLVATGPLTSEALCKPLFELLGYRRLAFFDSIAPVVEADSIDYEHAYAKNRWDKGDSSDFLNCPLDKEEYHAFVEALRQADTVEAKPFEKGQLFEGCLPIEEMAKRGVETLRFGPLRPIGLEDPRTGKRPHAVLQLRVENQHRTLYNLVGCQTRLKWGAQKKIFSLIPALKNAAYARMGAMHRNTFINAPEVLHRSLRLKNSNIFFAGQITGAEGYTEAVGTGFYAATMMYAHLTGQTDFNWPETTCLGALTQHIVHPNPNYQPMNLNFGLFPRPDGLPKSEKKTYIIEASRKAWSSFELPWKRAKATA